MKRVNVVLVISLLFIISGCGSSDNSKQKEDARYKVTFNSHFVAKAFPTGFPINKAHFSGLIGATHNKNVVIWKNEDKASAGIKRMAETGRKDTLKVELNKASGIANILDGSGIAVGGSVVSLEFSIDEEHSLVTLTSMAAPSPDWFVGVSGIALYDTSKKEWIERKTIKLKLYDAGTDSGSKFLADNLVTHPFDNITLLTEPEVDFENGVQSGSGNVIGTFVFERL